MAQDWELWPEQQPNIQANANQVVNSESNNVVNVPVVFAMPAIPQPREAFIELNDLLQNPDLKIDLNMAVEEDLGDIDNLAQGSHLLMKQNRSCQI